MTRKPKTNSKTKLGRPKGTGGNARTPRVLTPVQKLREHILIELDLDKSQIAAAIGTTRQSVSNVFLDQHRSDFEDAIIEQLRDAYFAAPETTRFLIDDIVKAYWPRHVVQASGIFIGGCPMTEYTLGWSKRSVSVEE